ncbi:hypothetical protein BRC82_06395 [Halobacteriales archaeon QS_1_67_19]|nr:MAG: hypothetical protein BRC82_06395 [Halobacteriales archaeon QS_1_67_19]
MHEPVPEAHEAGIAGVVRRLDSEHVACEDCGFEAAALGDAWDREVASDPLSGHVVYELTCPDCRNAERFVINF